MNKKAKKDKIPINTPHFNIVNWILLLAGIIVIGLGFFSLSKGSITLAPILLVAGYCVIIPVALLVRTGKGKKDNYA
jgi:uncharacterized membrane protein YdbT with pleckstrin-like domain